jgi:hypothetical protein
LIVPSEDCGSYACQSHAHFTLNKSSTAKLLNCDGSPAHNSYKDEVEITFGSGRVAGNCVEDRICIGTVCSDGAFITAVEESPTPFASFDFDGVLGLALTSMAQGPAFSMMERFQNSSALQEPLFSVFLSDSDSETSEITFGKVKQEHMASELFWVPVTGTAGYWEVHIEDITLAEKRQGICKNCRVAVDTGTSELAGPSELIDTMTSLLDMDPSCGNFDSLPEIGFIVAGKIMTLSPKEYVNGRSTGFCSLALMKLDVPPPNGPLFVFGIPFLQKYYSVYDHANKQVGFAVAKHAGETPPALLTVADIVEGTAT